MPEETKKPVENKESSKPEEKKKSYASQKLKEVPKNISINIVNKGTSKIVSTGTDLVPIIVALFLLFMTILYSSPLWPVIASASGMSSQPFSSSSEQTAINTLNTSVNKSGSRALSFVIASLVVIVIGAIFPPLAWLLILAAFVFMLYSGQIKL